MRRTDQQRQDEREWLLLLTVFYRGPWERIADWLYGFRHGREPQQLLPDSALRIRLAGWCSDRDTAWRRWHVRHGHVPAWVWRRR